MSVIARVFAPAFALVALFAYTGLASAQDQDTAIPGVTAKIAYLEASSSATRLGILFKNDTDKEAHSSSALEFAQIALVDPSGNRKLYALKDAEGHFLGGPISDWNDGGRWFPKLAKNSQTLVWALFDPIEPGRAVDVEVPSVGSFLGVAVSPAAAAPSPQAASSLPPVTMTLRAALRSAGQLRVQLLLQNPGSGTVSGPGIRFADIFALDTQGKRKYPLLKGTDGLYVASPMSDKNEGGRLFLSKVAAGGQLPLTLNFQAPPDDVRKVDIVVPLFAPLQDVTIVGSGGAEGGGIEVAGRSEELTRALAELGAQETPEAITLPLPADVLFDFDQATLKPEAVASLNQVLTVLNGYPGASISVEGHTDSKGTDAYNQGLSERRAQAVADWLVANGKVDRALIHTRGWGSSKPVAPNTKPDGSDDPEGRAKNRRVEIVVEKAG
ncbi:MAG: OmpA family protein [Pseudomonadota bacterium]